MKKNYFGLCFTFVLMFGLVACKKEKNDPPAPAPVTPSVQPPMDSSKTELQVSYINMLVSDLEMNCSFIGEYETGNYQTFYSQGPITNGTCTVIRDIATSRVSITYNQTTCRDGRLRDGAIYVFFAEPQYLQYPATGNETHIRDYNFTGRVSLQFYNVDGWRIKHKDFSAFIKNLRPNALIPVLGNLRWSFEGEFTMKKNQDSMSWKGKYIKTLENTSDPMVFNPNTQSAINWSLATISYKGLATGTTFSNVPFTFQIDSTKALQRDFLCSPDATSISTSTNVTITYPGFHPFNSGVVTYTSGTSLVRKIYYSNQENSPPHQCDNQATVIINGLTTTFTMWK